jgi:hypothetical protein
LLDALREIARTSSGVAATIARTPSHFHSNVHPGPVGTGPPVAIIGRTGLGKDPLTNPSWITPARWWSCGNVGHTGFPVSAQVSRGEAAVLTRAGPGERQLQREHATVVRRMVTVHVAVAPSATPSRREDRDPGAEPRVRRRRDGSVAGPADIGRADPRPR